MITWIARMLLLRRFGGRGLLFLGLLNFVRGLLGRRSPQPGVYEPEVYQPGAYQPSQGSSQTEQRKPR